MITPAEARSGKGHRDENFPVASRLIHPRHRAPILAFYEFVRTADDIADHASLPPPRSSRCSTGSRRPCSAAATTIRSASRCAAQLAERGLSPRHAQDLLTAFRLDVTKLRYRDWDELIDYCRYSAMPVGRFVLDVHGESRATWPANDALCAALQIINHLQDCGKDYRELDRVYIPLDALAATGVDRGIARRRARLAGVARCLRELARRTGDLLRESRPFSASIEDDAARPRGRGDPDACRAAGRPAERARSAERARPSRQGGGRGLRPRLA